MEREIEIQLSAIEETIASKGIKCRKNVFEMIDLLKEYYPNYACEIQELFKEICKKHKVDFYNEIRVSGEDINKHLDQF
jgi:hypothetical protein